MFGKRDRSGPSSRKSCPSDSVAPHRPTEQLSQVIGQSANSRGEMPFLEHLEEFRWRILWSVIALVIGTGIGLLLVIKFDVMALIISPLRTVMAEMPGATGDPEKLKFISPTEPFFFILKMGVLTGFILVSPIVIYQLWSFLAPALEKHEKRVIVPSLYFGMILFASGVAMAYYIALPVTLEFLVLFGNEWFEPMLTAGPYFAFVTRLLLAFGVVFELPVVVMILSALGLVTPAFLRSKRRHALVGITVLASMLSPGDIITVTVMMMVPLVVLYEVSIVLSAVIYRRRRKRDAEFDASPPDGSVEAE